MNSSRFSRLAIVFLLMAFLMIPFSRTTAEDHPGLIYLVDVYGKYIRVIYWAPDTVAYITILDESGTVIFQDWLSPNDYDDCGFFKETCAQYMLPDSVSLAPLRTIIAAANDHITVHHIVADVQVTSVDIETDTISGTLNPPRLPEHFYPLMIDTECNGTGEFHSTFDEYGNWSWDVSEACDLTYRSWGPIHYNPVYYVGDDYYAGWQLAMWWAGNPSFSVRANDNIIEALQWRMGSTITLEIDDPGTEPAPDFSETRSVDELCPWDQNQTYEFFELGIDIQPGFLVRMTDGVVTKTHTITTLAFTDIDVATDVVTGVAAAGSSVQIITCDEFGCYNLYPDPVADENGIWSANFTSIYDIVFGTWIDSSQPDEDGDSTLFGQHVPNPYFGVRGNDRGKPYYIEGREWPLGATVTFEIDDPTTESDPDYSGTADVVSDPEDPNQTWFETLVQGYETKAGDNVTVTDGNVIKQHTVMNFMITDVNLDTDTIYGIANPGQRVETWTSNPGLPNTTRVVFADENGEWFVNYSIPGNQDSEQDTADLRPGSWIDSVARDEDGDGTMYGWSVPRPVIEVRANDNIVEVYQWRMGSTVTLEIDDPSTELAPDYFVTRLVDELCPCDPNLSYEYFEVGSEIDIQPGFLIRMTDGITTKVHTVTTVAITDIDVDTDVVTGVAAAGSSVNTYICDDYGCHNPDPDPVTDENGIWTYDFTGIYDIVLGTWVEASQYDEDGDSTLFRQHVPRPVIEVRANDNIVDAFQWQMGSTINLEIDDPGTEPAPDFSETRSVDELCPWDPSQTCERFEVGNEIDIQPGFLIRMTDGITTKTHTVTTIAITAIDADTDVVTGVAEAGSSVDVWTCDDYGCYNQDPNPVANENGIWTYDFTGIYDIVLGTWVDSSQFDEDGDGTLFAQNVPNPYFEVRVSEEPFVDAFLWQMGSTITLEIDDPGTELNPDYSTTRLVDQLCPWIPDQTYERFEVGNEIEIQPGFEIRMTDGITTKTHTVTTLAITDIDVDTDVVTGVAAVGSIVDVWTCDDYGCYNPDPNPVTDENGIWIYDFTGFYDLVLGTWVDSSQFDEDGDGTLFGQHVPNPYFDVRANWDQVGAWEWPLGATLTLEIDDPATPNEPDFSTTQVANLHPEETRSYAEFNVGESIDIQPGFLIRMTDGFSTKTHTVTPLAITNIDIASDVVTGVAAADSSVDIWTCDEFGCYNDDPNPVADENGIWIYDFTGIYDIVLGTWIDSSQYDEDGDSTMFGQHVPNPRIKVFLEENKIDGFEWVDGTPIVITVDDPLTTQSPDFTSTQIANVTSDDIEQAVVSFDPGGLTLFPGMLVTMTDGSTTKTHIIPDCGWTSIDYDNDVISGWGEQGLNTVVWVYEETWGETTGRARHFLPNEDGTWTASFAEQGDEEWEMVFDILPGMSGGMTQKDADQDETIREWSDISLAINQPPVISAISAPLNPVQLGQGITASVTFSDPDAGDTHTITWDWGDGSTTSGPSASADHLYTQANVFTVTVMVTDAAGESDTALFQYVVIYDPSGGFVTGGGWILSPEGAYTPNPSLTGKATFGFVSKYLKGANLPTGTTEFQFHLANLNFKSTSYDWLVIAGTKAQYKGTGTINGAGEYKFMLTAIDGSPDKFRIKIWDKATGTVIYDNQIGSSDTADPITALGGGSIVIHKK